MTVAGTCVFGGLVAFSLYRVIESESDAVVERRERYGRLELRSNVFLASSHPELGPARLASSD